VLVHLVDVSSLSARDPSSDFDIIRGELARFPDAQAREAGRGDLTLADKPQIVAANKVDALDDPDRLARLRARVTALGLPFHEISAVTGAGVAGLHEAMWTYVAPAEAA
jgi:GTP-binding protein